MAQKYTKVFHEFCKVKMNIVAKPYILHLSSYECEM
jgi:hypothetical protein